MRIVWVRVFYLLSGLVWLAATINALVTIDAGYTGASVVLEQAHTLHQVVES